MKIITKILSALIILSFFGCASNEKFNSKNRILGTWERVGDRSIGTLIKVSKLSQEDVYIGTVKKVTKNNKKYFRVGEVSWQNIHPIGKNVWGGLHFEQGVICFFQRESLQN